MEGNIVSGMEKVNPSSIDMIADDSTKRTALDRSVSIVLRDPDTTASFKEGISPEIERLHRLHGTSLIFESSKLLSLSASTFATACTIFHRFYHQVSLTDCDVWSIAMASTLLATKVEEESHTLKAIIHVYCHLYRKRLLVVIDTNDKDVDADALFNHPSVTYLPAAKVWSLVEKDSYLEQLPLPMKLGPVYAEWHKQISDMEAVVLRQLGFTLYWIPDSHPHKFILYFCRVLELTDIQISQRAWNYCNDSCRLDLCVRFEPQLIASSSILLAANDFNISLPISPCPWWEVFVGKNKSNELVTVANSILGLVVKTQSSWVDSLVVSRGFIRSLKKSKHEDGDDDYNDEPGSFNDPGSFLWDYQKDLIELKKSNT